MKNFFRFGRVFKNQVQSDDTPLPTDIFLRTKTVFDRLKSIVSGNSPATVLGEKKTIVQIAKDGLQSLWKPLDLFVTTLTPPIPAFIWEAKRKQQTCLNTFLSNKPQMAKMEELRDEAKKLILKYKAESATTSVTPLAPIPADEEDLYDGSHLIRLTEKMQLILDLKTQLIHVYWKLLLLQNDTLSSMIQDIQDSKKLNADEKALLSDLEQLYLDSLTHISLLTHDVVIKEEKFHEIIKGEITQWMEALNFLKHIYSRIEREANEIGTIEAQLKQAEITIPLDSKQLAALRSNLALTNKTATKTKLVLRRHQIEMLDKWSKSLQKQALEKSLPVQNNALTEEELATLNKLKEIKQECLTKSQEIFDLHKKEAHLLIQMTTLPDAKNKKFILEEDIFPFTQPLNRLLNKPLDRLPSLLAKLPLMEYKNPEDLLNQKIDDIDAAALTPANLILSQKEEKGNLSWWQKARHLITNQIKVTLKTNFTATLTSLQDLKHSLKLQIKQEEIRLQQTQTSTPQGAAQEFILRRTQMTKNVIIIGLEKELNIINLSITQAKLTQLLDTLGNIQHIIKTQNKTIEENKKAINLQDKLAQLCDSLIQADNEHSLNPSRGISYAVDPIMETTSPEVQALFQMANETLVPYPIDKREALEAIKKNAQTNKAKLELENNVIQKNLENQNTSVKLLKETYPKLIRKYEQLYSIQPTLSFKDALSAETKNLLTRTISLSFISSRIPHPNEIRFKYRYADMGYSMEHEVLRYLEKLTVDSAKGETWQSVLQEEVKNFVLWAEKHPFTAANLASDVSQVIVLVRSTLDKGQALPPVIELFSALKAKIMAHALLGTLGRPEFDPEDEENELRYRALADLIRYAPVAFATMKGATQAMAAESIQGAVIAGIRGALTNATISQAIQQFVDSMPLIQTETWLRSLRLVFNTVLRHDLYVDSVVEQKNIQFTGFVSQIKQAAFHPQSVPKDLSNRLWRWWRSVQHAKGAEKTMRLVAQLAIPIIGISAIMATFFMMTTPGTFLATWIFGGNVGLFSAFGITGFVAFSIYQGAYNFGHYLSANFTETQRLVRRDEAQALFKNYKSDIKNHVNSYIKELRSRAILPILEPLGPHDQYPSHLTRKYEEIEATLIQEYTYSLEDKWRERIKEKKAEKAPITMKDCIHIFNQLTGLNQTLVETVRARAKAEIRASFNVKEVDDETLKKMAEIVGHHVLTHLEKEWLTPLMKHSYKEVLMRLYVDSFIPSYENAENAQRKSPEATLRQIFEGIDNKVMEPQKAQEWSIILNDAISGLRRLAGFTPSMPAPSDVV